MTSAKARRSGAMRFSHRFNLCAPAPLRETYITYKKNPAELGTAYGPLLTLMYDPYLGKYSVYNSAEAARPHIISVNKRT